MSSCASTASATGISRRPSSLPGCSASPPTSRSTGAGIHAAKPRICGWTRLHSDARRIQVPDQTLRADQQLLAEHHAKEIRDAIESLPAKQLAAVLMHKYEGMDYAAIAEVLDCSIPALKSLLFRAYETLRRRLAHFAPPSMA